MKLRWETFVCPARSFGDPEPSRNRFVYPFCQNKKCPNAQFRCRIFCCLQHHQSLRQRLGGRGALAALDWGRRASLGPGSGGGRSGSATIGLGNDGLQSRPTSSRRELDVYLFTCLKWLLVLVSSCFRRPWMFSNDCIASERFLQFFLRFSFTFTFYGIGAGQAQRGQGRPFSAWGQDRWGGVGMAGVGWNGAGH